jgi:hypothetical protein
MCLDVRPRHGEPRSPEWAPLLPKGVFAPDLPVPKRQRASETLRDPPANDGLHLHGVILANRSGRLTDRLDQHFQQKRSTYLVGALRTINLRVIDRDPSKAAEFISLEEADVEAQGKQPGEEIPDVGEEVEMDESLDAAALIEETEEEDADVPEILGSDIEDEEET